VNEGAAVPAIPAVENLDSDVCFYEPVDGDDIAKHVVWLVVLDVNEREAKAVSWKSPLRLRVLNRKFASVVSQASHAAASLQVVAARMCFHKLSQTVVWQLCRFFGAVAKSKSSSFI